MTDLSRRGLLGAFIGIVAAPAIVRASSLMPVKVVQFTDGKVEVIERWRGMGTDPRFIRDLLFPGLAAITATYDRIPFIPIQWEAPYGAAKAR